MTKQIVKDDVEVFLRAINENQNKNFSEIWGQYNNNSGLYKHPSCMHAGQIVFPTYTATSHNILCNTLPDSLLLKQIVCDKELMKTYNEIYKYFCVRITKKSEYKVWETQCPFFFIDAFKVLLAGHYMAHNIFGLEQLSKKNGIYKYQQWPYQITWKQQTIQQSPYKDFLNTLREIGKQEDFLKTMQNYIVTTNKPIGTRNNPSFALASKYFIDELLVNNKLRGTGGKPTYNFNMVFDALVVSEINGKTKKEKYDKFLKYLQEYQNKFSDIKNNNVYNAINNIILNGYDPDKNCINGRKNGIAKYNTNNLNIYNYNYQNKS